MGTGIGEALKTEPDFTRVGSRWKQNNKYDSLQSQALDLERVRLMRLEKERRTELLN